MGVPEIAEVDVVVSSEVMVPCVGKGYWCWKATALGISRGVTCDLHSTPA